ncbi:MAG TPA: type II toxin-antitoxin system RelE/ParE family toxin [Terracidiphilus sp.]|jgi:hypothetical protein|nr:type II toxin-antitoxin system RelE/ParE family toxin [Terracidiphilus sp.]
MRVFKTRWFGRFSRQEVIPDISLREAVSRAERGLIDADLGGGLIKQRVARQGQGRSGGYRTIIAYRSGSTAFFLHGFAKGDRDNIGEDELSELKKFGRRLLTADVETLNGMFEDGSLKEVNDDQEE